jgi:L-fucose mutarotase
MLKGIDPLLSPELLHALAAMGHGDTLAIVDANFPACAMARRLVRLDGIDAPRALRAVLSLLPVDSFVERPIAVMQVVGNPTEQPDVVREFRDIARGEQATPEFDALERFVFYDRVREAFAVVATGERRLYGNVIIRKGVIGPEVTPAERPD